MNTWSVVSAAELADVPHGTALKMTVFIGGGAPAAHGKLLAKSLEGRTNRPNEARFLPNATPFHAFCDCASGISSPKVKRYQRY
jgi:hypothetical protein